MDGTYDKDSSLSISLHQLVQLLQAKGCGKIYTKPLAPNDNSKNQPYLAGHLNDLSFLHKEGIIASQTTSTKSKASKNSVKYLVDFPLTWVDAEGALYLAPKSKLIYYPQYPEVRFSGYLMGSKVYMSKWMAPEKMGRAEGRWLVIGSDAGNMNYGFLAVPRSRVANELKSASFIDTPSKLQELQISGSTRSELNSKEALLKDLKKVWQLGWLPGQRLSPTEGLIPYLARNAGGYTLEAALGISANGIAEPDLHGWEIKQFSRSVTTLMDHSPDGGFYKENGIAAFIREYGYPDKNGIPDRLNFGGVHRCGDRTPITGLAMHIDGYDHQQNSIIKADGKISLVCDSGNEAASWSFQKIMGHWQKKHSRTVYVPSKVRKTDGGSEYYYGPTIELGSGVSFANLLGSYYRKCVYYDPGLKLENASQTTAKSKARHSMRVKHKDIASLYERFEFIDLSETT